MNRFVDYKHQKPDMVESKLTEKDNDILKRIAIAWMELSEAMGHLSEAHAPDEEHREIAVETIRRASNFLEVPYIQNYGKQIH